MSLFAKALRCLYQDKDAVYLWPEGFAACAAVCAESRGSLDDVWTDLGSMTDAYVLRLASALHTDPYIAAMRAAEDSEGEDVSDEVGKHGEVLSVRAAGSITKTSAPLLSTRSRTSVCANSEGYCEEEESKKR